ncbi:MAG: histidine kinase [Prevotella sp.]|nr:histidine kinase [Prevotella sp.]
MLMLVFYTNYFWLIPKKYVEGNHRLFWIVNIVLILTVGIAEHFFLWKMYLVMDEEFRANPDSSVKMNLVYIFRNLFNLSMAAAIALTIVLSEQWHESLDAKLNAEAEAKEAELKNLRSQINPHFLLNTLNNIYALTAFDKEKAQEAIQELSKLLRHMLYDNQQPLVSLSQEVQFMENYVNLMKLRLPANVDVKFSAHCDSPDVPVAPLIFISLVENAFKHGVSSTEPSFIDIQLSSDDQRIVCDIENSNFPKDAQDRSGHGIGLQQVERRLALVYPQRYQWTKGVSEDGKKYRSRIEIQR